MGISGITIELLKDYRSNRKQQVKIGNTYTDPRILEYGVLQGTVLESLLFNIYLNDLFKTKSYILLRIRHLLLKPTTGHPFNSKLGENLFSTPKI